MGGGGQCRERWQGVRRAGGHSSPENEQSWETTLLILVFTLLSPFPSRPPLECTPSVATPPLQHPHPPAAAPFPPALIARLLLSAGSLAYCVCVRCLVTEHATDFHYDTGLIICDFGFVSSRMNTFSSSTVVISNATFSRPFLLWDRASCFFVWAYFRNRSHCPFDACLIQPLCLGGMCLFRLTCLVSGCLVRCVWACHMRDCHYFETSAFMLSRTCIYICIFDELNVVFYVLYDCIIYLFIFIYLCIYLLNACVWTCQ